MSEDSMRELDILLRNETLRRRLPARTLPHLRTRRPGPDSVREHQRAAEALRLRYGGYKWPEPR